MSIHKITPFLPNSKDFFKNSDMTAAMQSISSILSQIKTTERYKTRDMERIAPYRHRNGFPQGVDTAIAEVFGLPGEEVYDVVINHSDELAHIAEFYNPESAS